MSSRNYALKGETRDRAGKGVARALRRENSIPAVIYGDGKAPVSITLPIKEVALEFKKGHMYTSLCTLGVSGADHLVLAREVQLHPVTDAVMHIDFLRVTPKTKLHVQVPLHFINEADSPGLTTEKGVLNISTHELDLVCIATEIPDHIDIDLKGMVLGTAIHLSDIKLPSGATADALAVKRNITIATIAEPRRIIEEVAPAAAEGAAGAEGAPAAEGAAAPAAGAAAPAAGGDKKAAAPAKGDKK